MGRIIILIIFICFSFCLSGQSTKSGIKCYLKLENTTGVAVDQKGDYDGTVSGATRGSTGKIGDCFDFDGTNDYIDCNDIDIVEDMTVMCWVNLDGTSSVVSAKRDATYYSWDFSFGGTNIIYFGVNDNASRANSTPTTVSTGTWTHIAGVYDGTACKVYINGDIKGSNGYSGGITQSNVDVTIARRAYIGAEGYLDGRIDEYILYKRALSPLEIKQHYNYGDGLLFVQENFKNDYDYEKLICYVIDGLYIGFFTGTNS